jgi:undecaprenyl-diphosphatase
MDIFQAILLGIVEGITEFLPVSSTGHLILAGKMLGVPDSDFQKSFEIIIQLGAILSVVVLYWRALLVSFETQKKIAAAFLPTAVVGLVLYKIIKTYLLGNAGVVVVTLFVGGILIIIFEKWHAKQPKENLIDDISGVSYKQAAIIGLCQSAAVIPGVSRSAATILGGLGLGIKRETIVEFSFLLAVPTMLAATALDLLKNASAFSSSDTTLLAVGFLTSFVVALAVIKGFIGFVQKYTFVSFGVYRIIAAALFWFFLLP